MRAFAWPVILQQCKWATARGGALTRTGKALLSSLDADVLKAGFNNLLTSDSFDELRRVNRIRGQWGRAKRYMTKPSPHMLWPGFDGCWGTDNDAFCGRYDGLLYVKLNTLGAYCLGNINQYAPPEQNSVKNLAMLDNFYIVYSGCVDPPSYDNMMLDRFAKRKNDYTWKLVEKNLLDFIDKGGTLDEVIGFIEQNSGTSVPGVFKKLFEGIGKKQQSLESPEEALLIKTRDDITAMLIANDTSAKKYCFRAGENRLAVPHKHLGAFKTCLKKNRICSTDMRTLWQANY